MHYIQKYILDQLIANEKQRFTDLRYPGVESNLFQYHLQHVVKAGYVSKLSEGGYSLSPAGLYYADRYSGSLKTVRPQPKIIVIPVVQDRHGRVAVVKKQRQPFINTWHLPAGKIHPLENLQDATAREVDEKLGVQLSGFAYQGSVHATIMKGDDVVSEYYGFVMRVVCGRDIAGVEWLGDDTTLPLAPSVRELLDIVRHPAGQFHEVVTRL